MSIGLTDRFDRHDYMFLRELNFIKLFRCDLTTEVNNGRRTTFKNQMTITLMQVITRRQWSWISSSEIMFVNYYFGRNHHDNVHDWNNLQRKQCMKEAVDPYNSAKTLRIFFSGDRVSARAHIITPFPTRLPPNWPHQLQTPSCGPDCIALYRFVIIILWQRDMRFISLER